MALTECQVVECNFSFYSDVSSHAVEDAIRCVGAVGQNAQCNLNNLLH